MSQIAYKGKVRVDFYRGSKCYRSITAHNNGTSELFRYMANCMIGNYNQSLMPRYIHTFVVSDADILEAESNVDKRSKLWDPAASTSALNVPFSSVQVREGTGGTTVEREYVAEYSFLIPASQLQRQADNKIANVICLYNNVWDSNNVLTPLAYIVLKDDMQLYLDSSTTNIIITWELSILNQEA